MLNDVTEQKLYKTNENHLIIDQTSVIYKKLGMLQHTKTEPEVKIIITPGRYAWKRLLRVIKVNILHHT